MVDSPGDVSLFVVIVTGMFIAVAPTMVQLLWLAGVALAGLLWQRHVKRTAPHDREQSRRD